MSGNGKTYTETVSELKDEMSDLKVDVIDRINDNQLAVLDRLDDITSGQAAAEERDKAQSEKIEINRKNILRVGGVNLSLAAIGSYIATKLGLSG